MNDAMTHSDEEILANIDKWVNANLGSSFSFRQHQKENILAIISGIANGTCKTRVIEAPTGSGKSIIILVSAGVLSEYYSFTSYILCSDLFLWSQYEDFIKKNNINFGTIKGQTGNYCCARNNNDMKNAECRMAGIPWKQLFFSSSANACGFPCAKSCEYVQCRKKCIDANVVLMTYQLFLYQMNVVNAMGDEGSTTFPMKDIIFCDECHNIPDIVQQKFTPTISIEVIEKLVGLFSCAMSDRILCSLNSRFSTSKDLYDFLTDIYEKLCDDTNSNEQDIDLFNSFSLCAMSLKEVADVIQDKIKILKRHGKNLSKKDREDFKLCTFLQNYMCYLNDFDDAICNAGDEHFIKQVNKQAGSRDIISVQFHCAKEDMMVANYLLRNANYRVLMSATVGGHEAFAENNGFQFLENDPYEFNTIPSTFDFNDSEIEIDDEVWFTYSNKQTALNSIRDKVYSLLRQHPGQRGIVQTGSYENAYYIMNNAPLDLKRRMLIYSTSKEKSETISQHKQSSDTILVGPTLCEGIDFPDDQCRFIVVMKVPYPSLADKLVKAKMKLFPRWYSSKTSNAIIQGLGRGIRHKTDWCKSYILDGCFARLLNETYEQYPEEMRKRFIRV